MVAELGLSVCENANPHVPMLSIVIVAYWREREGTSGHQGLSAGTLNHIAIVKQGKMISHVQISRLLQKMKRIMAS